MGRVKHGDLAQGEHLSQGKRAYRPRNKSLALVAPAPSRRKPFGVYSVLGVLPSASAAEIKTAYRARMLEVHPDRHPTAKGQELAALTRQSQAVGEAFAVLSSAPDRNEYDIRFAFRTSSARVQQHRSRQTALQKKIVSAKTVCRSVQLVRRKAAKKKEVGLKGKVEKNADIVYEDGMKKKRGQGVVLQTEEANSNNRFTKQWVVVKRSKAALKKDKRLSKIVVVPVEQV